jgi:hypothetical protein
MRVLSPQAAGSDGIGSCQTNTDKEKSAGPMFRPVLTWYAVEGQGARSP